MKLKSLLAGLGLLACMSVTALGAQAIYFVSPSGNDNNPGTQNSPFLTIEKARQVVDGINDNMTGDIVVYLRGGTYQLTATQYFDETDGGSNGNWVVYKNYSGETPAFSGGISMNGGWSLVSGHSDIYEKTFPEITSGAWWPRSMYADDKRLTDLNVDLGMYWNGSSHCDTVAWTGWCMNRKGPFYNGSISMIIDEGHVPESYAINKSSGKIYLHSSVNPNSRDIRAPKLEILFDIKGTRSARINNLRFEGLTFQHTLWPFPVNGYNERAWGNYAHFRNDHTDVNGDIRAISNMVTVEYGRHLEFLSCKFGHTENNGLGFGRGTDQCRINGCEFFDNGAKGLYIGYRGRCTADGWVKNDWACGKGREGCREYPGTIFSVACLWYDVEADIPDSFEVTDNVAHDAGRIYRGCPGIHIEAIRSKCYVAYNEFYNTWYSGLIFQNFQMPKANAEIRNNLIHDCHLQFILGDGQPVYESNNDNGIIETNNVFWSNGHTEHSGIYLDQYGCAATIQYNVFQPTTDEFIYLTEGTHTIRDNIRGATQFQIDSARALAGPRSNATSTKTPSRYCGPTTLSTSLSTTRHFDIRGRLVKPVGAGRGILVRREMGPQTTVTLARKIRF